MKYIAIISILTIAALSSCALLSPVYVSSNDSFRLMKNIAIFDTINHGNPIATFIYNLEKNPIINIEVNSENKHIRVYDLKFIKKTNVDGYLLYHYDYFQIKDKKIIVNNLNVFEDKLKCYSIELYTKDLKKVFVYKYLDDNLKNIERILKHFNEKGNLFFIEDDMDKIENIINEDKIKIKIAPNKRLEPSK